jgi:hypothetical protein
MKLKETDSGDSAKSKCARCHRQFTPKKEGQRYGEKCARLVAAMQTLDYVDLKNPDRAVA